MCGESQLYFEPVLKPYCYEGYEGFCYTHIAYLGLHACMYFPWLWIHYVYMSEL